MLGLRAVGLDRGQHLHFLAHPVGAALLVEVGGKLDVDIAQVRDVGDRVAELRRRERTPRPVGEAVRLVEVVAGDAGDKLVVGDRITIAQDHGGDLGVDERGRNHVRPMPADFDVLPGGMEDLDHVGVGHQFEERRQVDALGERIDHDGLFGRGQLRHAQDRVIGRFALKFGVDRHEGVTCEPLAGLGQFLGLGDWLHMGAR